MPTARSTAVGGFDPDALRALRRQRGFAIVAFALVCLLAGQAEDAGARAMIEAPNSGGGVVSALPPPEVSRAIRAEVGPPSAVLEAWIVEPEGPATATVLLLHAEGRDKRSMIPVARALARRDIRAVAVDLRGHGGSSGRWLTYGVVESQDLAQLLDELDAVGILEGPVGVYGASYGAAVALQLAAIDPRVTAVVASSTITSFRETVSPYAERHLPGLGTVLPTALVDALVDSAGELGGFTPEAADVRSALSRSGARTLFLHGARDRMVPAQRMRTLTQACAPRRCALLSLRSLDHQEAASSARSHEAAVLFLARALGEPPSAGGVGGVDEDRSTRDTWE